MSTSAVPAAEPSTDSGGIEYTLRGQVAHVLINRPQVANALAPATMEGLVDAFIRADQDPAVRVIVVRGAGERAFSAGVDLGISQQGAFVHPMKRSHRNFHEVILETEKPTIAAINGAAVAGGCEIALACDLRVAVRHARIGMTEAKVGMGGFFGTVMLSRLIPKAIAMELLFTGRLLSADEALALGLFNRVVDADQLDTVVDQLATAIAANAPLTVRKMKLTANKGDGLPLSAALRLDVGPDVYNSEDRVEGARAFKEKRPPNFKGK